MYTIEHNKDYGITTLASEKWKLTLMQVKGHVHVQVRGPNGYRRRGLSNVAFDVLKSAFEHKAVALYFYRLAREHYNHSRYDGYNEPKWIVDTNYADVFGSCFD